MIQDRDVQNLWDAVEGTGDDDMEYAFVASATSNRKTFHLRGCKFTSGFMKAANGFREYRTHEEAVEDGRVPCKTCGA